MWSECEARGFVVCVCWYCVVLSVGNLMCNLFEVGGFLMCVCVFFGIF